MRLGRVTGAGGVGLALREAGDPGRPPVVLIHGWSQHSLSWAKQLRGPLADAFHLIAPDLRGHGASDKPAPPGPYRDSRAWADDVAAILDQRRLERPVLVGWSMGGWVVADYLRHHGDAALAGIVLIGAGARSGAMADPAVMAKRRPDARAEGMYSEDQAEAIAATIAFVKACTAAPLSKRDLATMVGFNMLVPPAIRQAARTRDEDWRADLARVSVPALVVQGAAERVCLAPMFEEMVATIPGAESLVYPGAGHAPFWEMPERFDADLARFARAARGAA